MARQAGDNREKRREPAGAASAAAASARSGRFPHRAVDPSAAENGVGAGREGSGRGLLEGGVGRGRAGSVKEWAGQVGPSRELSGPGRAWVRVGPRGFLHCSGSGGTP